MEDKLFLLFWLFVAHGVGDYLLQPLRLVKGKKEDIFSLLIHCFIWSGAIAFVLEAFGVLSLSKIIILLSGHFVLDFFKPVFPKKHKNWIDQFGHYLQLIIVWLI